MNIKHHFYDLIMCGLAIVVVAILIIESAVELTPIAKTIFAYTDITILIIFAVDYLYRLIKAPQKWTFMKANIFDLIAIIPLDKAFRIARLARLTRLARLSKTTRLTRLTRVMLFFRRIFNTISGILKTNGLHYVLTITLGVIIAGGFGIYALEPNMESLGDALWWSLVTTTTVGYGDISPVTLGGRLLAGLLMLVGIGLLGMVTGSIATYFVNKLNKEPDSTFVNDTLRYVIDQLGKLQELSSSEVEILCNTIQEVHRSQAEVAGAKE